MGGALNRWLEMNMACRPVSWTRTTLWFLFTLTSTIGLTLAFNSTLRHQVGSMHSDFWQLAVSADLGAIALLAIAMRFIFNRSLASRNRANLETHERFSVVKK
jgi:hypothetical protein